MVEAKKEPAIAVVAATKSSNLRDLTGLARTEEVERLADSRGRLNEEKEKQVQKLVATSKAKSAQVDPSSNEAAAVSGDGGWCADGNGGPNKRTGASRLHCNAARHLRGHIRSLLGVDVPAMKFIRVKGLSTQMALRPHGQQQPCGRAMVGLGLR